MCDYSGSRQSSHDLSFLPLEADSQPNKRQQGKITERIYRTAGNLKILTILFKETKDLPLCQAGRLELIAVMFCQILKKKRQLKSLEACRKIVNEFDEL